MVRKVEAASGASLRSNGSIDELFQAVESGGKLRR